MQCPLGLPIPGVREEAGKRGYHTFLNVILYVTALLPPTTLLKVLLNDPMFLPKVCPFVPSNQNTRLVLNQRSI